MGHGTGGRATWGRRVVALSMLASAACTTSEPAPGVSPLFDPMLSPRGEPAATWLAYPFPSDHRRTPDGHARFSDFPNPFGVDLLSAFVAEAESTLDGFATQGLAYVAFDGGIDVSHLPTAPDAYLAADTPIALVDITPGSPELGRLRPLRWQYWSGGGDTMPYLAPNTLGVGPAWGFPLRERTTYALVVFRGLADVDGHPVRTPALVNALLTEDGTRAARASRGLDAATFGELYGEFAGVRTWLASTGRSAADVLVATVFTTQTVTDELAAIRAQIATDRPAPAYEDAGWQPVGGANVYSFADSYAASSSGPTPYHVMEGRYHAPNYQEGDVPYDTGGALHIVAGVPTPVRDEAIRFVLTIPDAPPAGGLPCYPIVIYGHGTGGSAYSMRYDHTAGRLAAHGMAGISIDQPMHGIRAGGLSFDVELASFNLFNPAAFRSNFRQSAIDTFSLVRFVRESLFVPASKSPTGQRIDFCPDRVAYFGHSHGGLSGALAAPFEHDVDTWMLSGAGGGFSMSILDRKDILDFSAVFQALFAVPEPEAWSGEHPILTLLQTLAAISDPIDYGRFWNRDAEHRVPTSVMLTSGEHDAETPYRTASALAVSAAMPLTNPVVLSIPAFGWEGLSPVSAPLLGNVNGATSGFLQFTNDIPGTDVDTHFLVFHRPEAIDASMHFLETGVYGSLAELRRVPGADAR